MANSSVYRQFGSGQRAEEAAYYLGLHDQTLSKISSSEEEWKEFLEFAARLTRFSFDETVYIYAQNPDATICANYEGWNKIKRSVQRGNHGYRVLHSDQDGKRSLIHIFDISQTYGDKQARPSVWNGLPKDQEEQIAFMSCLYQKFGSGDQDFRHSLMVDDVGTWTKKLAALQIDKAIKEGKIPEEKRAFATDTLYFMVVSRFDKDAAHDPQYCPSFYKALNNENIEDIVKIGNECKRIGNDILFGSSIFFNNLKNKRTDVLANVDKMFYTEFRELTLRSNKAEGKENYGNEHDQAGNVSGRRNEENGLHHGGDHGESSGPVVSKDTGRPGEVQPGAAAGAGEVRGTVLQVDDKMDRSPERERGHAGVRKAAGVPGAARSDEASDISLMGNGAPVPGAGQGGSAGAGLRDIRQHETEISGGLERGGLRRVSSGREAEKPSDTYAGSSQRENELDDRADGRAERSDGGTQTAGSAEMDTGNERVQDERSGVRQERSDLQLSSPETEIAEQPQEQSDEKTETTTQPEVVNQSEAVNHSQATDQPKVLNQPEETEQVKRERDLN